VDTRGNTAVTNVVGVLAAGQQVYVPIAAMADVPEGASAAWLNVAAVPQGGGGAITLYPGPCTDAPGTTNVSVVRGRATSAAALVALGGGGVCVRAEAAPVHVVIDLTGWFGGPVEGGLAYRALAPDRVFDSRPSPTVAANGTVQVAASGATLFNIAAIGSGGVGFASAMPCGSGQVTALVNTAAGETVSNLAAVAPGTGGSVCVSPSVATHLAVDVTGRFLAPPV
jgi:hypothetical protein